MPEALTENLQALIARYPLPPGWAVANSFHEVATVAKLRLELVGLIAKGGRQGGGEEIEATGSAAGIGARPTERAFFELLERASLLQALATPRQWSALSFAGQSLSALDHGEVFPSVPEDERVRYVYSKSNGVALGPTFEFAAERARFELLERDAILRSWYGQQRPRSAEDLASKIVHSELRELYDFRLYEIPCSGAYTGVAAAFPKRAEAPLLLGFAAREQREDAVRSAYSEALQRLGFLWGEEIPTQEPAFEMTPAYHQELYLWPAKAEPLRAWLSGGHERYAALLEPQPPVTVRYVVLRGDATTSGPVAVRALSAQCLPLVFGAGHPQLSALPPALQTHPIA